MFTFAIILAWITAGLTVASMVYSLLSVAAAFSFRRYARQAESLPAYAPPVSILKPVKGLDAGMYEAFRSHCMQDYAGESELIFGAGSEADPAVEAVRRLQAEFPERAIRLVMCPLVLGTNGKVSNLVQMMASDGGPRFEFLLIDDSDIRVSPQYLSRVMKQFGVESEKPVGMVTALYRGLAAQNASGRMPLGSLLEALGISTDFMAGVLVSRLVERGIHFGLGSTLAVRRQALQAAGGLEALVDQLADDYEMGVRIERAGYTIRLAGEVVETSVPPYTMRGFVEHQLRWCRTVRDSRRWGYTGLLVTFLLPLALANVLAAGASFWSLWLLGMAFFLRLGTAVQVGSMTLGDGQVLRDLWLVPLRDFVGFAIWLWSFAGDTIVWRGERFQLKGGRLLKVV